MAFVFTLILMYKMHGLHAEIHLEDASHRSVWKKTPHGAFFLTYRLMCYTAHKRKKMCACPLFTHRKHGQGLVPLDGEKMH